MGEIPFALSALRGFRVAGFPILTYHSISDEPGWDVETVTPEAFDAQMRWLRGHGFRTVTMSALAESLRDPPDGRTVAITFDDGYQDNLTHALPILARYAAVATCYVPTADIGGLSTWNPRDYIGHRRMLDADGIRALNRGGVEIGSHGHNHVDWRALDESTVRLEIARSLEILQRILGSDVRGLAPPHGKTEGRIARIARELGLYHVVKGGRFAVASPGDSPWDLARITIARGDSLREFGKKVTGAYSFLSWRG
jgi:peptidoglycan/xylan/chitin deacetylase (PgdA/CDA1 family)